MVIRPQAEGGGVFLRKIVQLHAAIRADTEATPGPGPCSSVQLQVKSARGPDSSGQRVHQERIPGPCQK